MAMGRGTKTMNNIQQTHYVKHIHGNTVPVISFYEDKYYGCKLGMSSPFNPKKKLVSS